MPWELQKYKDELSSARYHKIALPSWGVIVPLALPLVSLGFMGQWEGRRDWRLLLAHIAVALPLAYCLWRIVWRRQIDYWSAQGGYKISSRRELEKVINRIQLKEGRESCHAEPKVALQQVRVDLRHAVAELESVSVGGSQWPAWMTPLAAVILANVLQLLAQYRTDPNLPPDMFRNQSLVGNALIIVVLGMVLAWNVPVIVRSVMNSRRERLQEFVGFLRRLERQIEHEAIALEATDSQGARLEQGIPGRNRCRARDAEGASTVDGLA